MAISRELFLSILSLDAYNRGYHTDVADLGSAPGTVIGNARILRDDHTAPAQAASFYAVAYDVSEVAAFADTGITKVISYRGTDDLHFRADVWTGWTVGAGFSGASQAGLALQFYQDVTNQSVFDGPVSDLVITGHSLGGGLAGMASALSGSGATIFDPMPFAIASVLAYTAEASQRLLTLHQPPAVPSYSQIDATYVTGEALQAVRALGPAAEVGIVSGLNPFIGAALAGYTFGAELAVNDTALDPHLGSLTLAPIRLHSQALLVVLEYARERNLSAWYGIGGEMISALFDSRVSSPIAGDPNPPTPQHASDRLNNSELRTMIAYSALDEGIMPFGNTAIRSLLDDADDLGRLYTGGVGNRILDGQKVRQALAEIDVQFAGDLAYAAVNDTNTTALTGVIGVDNTQERLSVDLDPTRWASTFSSAGQQKITGVVDLISGLLTARAFQNPIALSSLAASTPFAPANLDTKDITQILAMTGAGSSTLHGTSAPADHHGNPGGVVLIGAGALDQILGGAGGDWLFGADDTDALRGAAGNDFLVGGTGDDQIFGGDGRDTAIYQFNHDQYDWIIDGTTVTVKSKFGVPDGIDTLHDVESLLFADGVSVKVGSTVTSQTDHSAGTAPGSFTSDGGVIASDGGVSGTDADQSQGVGANVINGNSTPEQLYGTSGADVFHGMGGDDVLTGYAGQDTFDGGPGSDTVDYSYQPADVPGTIILTGGSGTATFPGFYTEDLISIENVWMGAGDDTVTGDAGDNDLRGGPGNDTLQGGSGNDRIYGDWKFSDKGGNDTAILSYNFGDGYTVSGSPNALHIVGTEGDDWYYHIENFRFADSTMTAAEVFGSGSYPNFPYPIKLLAPTNSSVVYVGIGGHNEFIAFESAASNLVAGDTNNSSDIFLYDLSTQQLERITDNSLEDSFLLATSSARARQLSDDGRYILMGGPTGNDITIYDRLQGTFETHSVAFDLGIGPPEHAISGDGRFVIYGEGGAKALFDRTTGLSEQLPISGQWVSINYDGRFIAYQDFLNPGVSVYDRLTQTSESISPSFGSQTSISGDGRYVAFNAGDSISIYDRQTQTTERIASGQTFSPQLSEDGRFVTFTASASNLVPGDNNNRDDVFVYDLIHHTIDGITVNNGGPFQFVGFTAVSGDGKLVAFTDPGGVHLVDRSSPNRAPVARDDNVDTTESSFLAGDLLANNGNGPDADPDGDILRVATVNGLPSNVGHSLTLSSGATLTVNRDGRFVYDPSGAFDLLGGGVTGSDTFSYTISDGSGLTDSATVAITVHGLDSGLQVTLGAANDLMSGTPRDDQINGGDGDDTISGGAGYDWLEGGAGNDTLQGQTGSDVLDGGEGKDTASHATAMSGVSASLSDPSTNTGEASGDLYFSIANLQGSNFGDALSGDASDNVLTGLGGSDLLQGAAGNDTLIGDGQLLPQDQITATLQGTILQFDGSGFDATRVHNATVVKVGDAYQLLYAGMTFGDNYDIGLASSSDGTIWNKYSSDPVIPNTGSQSWGSFRDLPVTVMHENGTYRLWFIGDNKDLASTPGYGIGFGVATSTDAIHWNLDPDNPIRWELNSPSNNGSILNEVVKLHGQYIAYYVDRNPMFDVLKYTLSADGVHFAGDTQLLIPTGYNLLAATTLNDELVFSVWRDSGGAYHYGTSADGIHITFGGLIDLPADFNVNDVLFDNSQVKFFGHLSVGNVNGFSNTVIQLATAPLPFLSTPGSNDTLSGGDGNDILIGGAGADAMFGDAGVDTASYELATVGVQAALVAAGFNDAAGDTFSGVENIRGSNLADVLTGDDFVNTLSGLGGNDLLQGGGGNDVLIGGAGADALMGNAGSDTASYETAALGVNASLLNLASNTNDAAGDTYAGMENLMGSNQADSLAGDSFANALSGLGGNDTLDGGGGNDIITAGLGNDVLIGRAGADAMFGNGGVDTASYETATLGVQASLANAGSNTNDAAGDTYGGIENLTGSNQADSLNGNSLANVLSGLNGDDTLVGGGGNDIITAGIGNDILIGGAGADAMFGNGGIDTASYEMAALAVKASLATPGANTNDAVGDTYVGIENLTGSNQGDALVGDNLANFISGLNGNDTITAGSGNDLMIGGLGADAMFGNGGLDAVSYQTATTGVIASLATPGINTNDAAGDTYAGVENLIGSTFADTLTGDSLANALSGLSGDDTIDGGVGNDVLTAGVGNDKLIGGSGSDAMFGNDGIDTASYETATLGVTASLISPASNTNDAAGDTYGGIENLMGSNQADTLTGDVSANSLSGLDGNDTLDGGGGNDVLIGGAGADALFGNAGIDTVSYETATLSVAASLESPNTNANDAAGDMYGGIENLTGSALADTLTGDNLANLISGLGGNDTLNGGGGNDTLVGGAGNDVLTGGSGLDGYLFNTALNAITNVDHIADFVVADDTIRLENAVFTAFSTTGTLAAGSFVTATAAADANDFIIYNSATSQLFYDADGSGGVLQIQFATLATGLVLTNNDFFIV